MARREFNRAQRLGDQIHRELALVLESEVDDPRVKGVTVTAVKLSRDLAHARVYFTNMEDGEAREQALQGLTKAVPFLRHLLTSRITSRIIPRLSFIYDVSVEHGRHMEDLIRQVVGHGQDPERDD